LALASALAMEQRRRDGTVGVQAGRDVGDGDADLDRRAILVARDAHQPAHGRHHDVVTGAIAVRARLSEARDRGVDLRASE